MLDMGEHTSILVVLAVSTLGAVEHIVKTP